jgi:hypothetical protein
MSPIIRRALEFAVLTKVNESITTHSKALLMLMFKKKTGEIYCFNLNLNVNNIFLDYSYFEFQMIHTAIFHDVKHGKNESFQICNPDDSCFLHFSCSKMNETNPTSPKSRPYQ